MTRTRIGLMISVAAALAVTGCGAGAPAADVAAEAVALEAVGFTATTAEAGEDAAKNEDRPRPRVIGQHLRKNTLHGELTVQGRDGVRTVVVQRGEITAVTGSGLTVKSTDGFELSWTYGDPVRIVRDGEKIERTALKTGMEVGLGGLRDGSATAARLIRVK